MSARKEDIVVAVVGVIGLAAIVTGLILLAIAAWPWTMAGAGLTLVIMGIIIFIIAVNL